MFTSNFRNPQQNKGNYKKTEFIDLKPGQHIIRIITTSPVVHDTHFVKGYTIKCIGEGCPICVNNKKIIAENQENFRNVPGYNGRRQVAYVNVLDKTVAKVCPSCNAEVKKVGTVFPQSCPSCNAALVQVEAKPLNKVKVLSKGKTFFDQLDFIDASILDEATQTPVGVANMDLSVLVMANSRSTPTVAPTTNYAPIEYKEEDLFDLEKAIIVLNSEEINDLLRGNRLSDILAARKAVATTTENPLTGDEGSANALINDLFS